MGHTLLRGYRDTDPTANSIIFAGDYFAGLHGALATMMAVWHRQQTGRGQLVEVAQAEAASAMFAQAYMDHALTRRAHAPAGNRSIYPVAPCGVYPCRSPGSASDGEDRWIAITVNSDQEWLALCREMGQPDWAEDPRLATVEGRVALHDLIDEHLARWTAQFDDYEIFHRLQAAGVAAAPVLEASRALDDPHLRQRGAFTSAEMYDKVGTFPFLSPFYRFPETPSELRQAPAALGEHNEYVYRDVLGLDAEEFERLREQGHITMEFDETIP
jgi:crotonobetainyl-CoA:carnitine CoA-transferase CaiB-like acyl-CoA transferase